MAAALAAAASASCSTERKTKGPESLIEIVILERRLATTNGHKTINTHYQCHLSSCGLTFWGTCRIVPHYWKVGGKGVEVRPSLLSPYGLTNFP